MKNTTLTSFLILTIVQFLFLPLQTAQLQAETQVWDGTAYKCLNGAGTKEDPYRVLTAEELAYMLQNFDKNRSICSHRYFKLMQDIDMQNLPCTFCSTSSVRRSFTSHFDGNGHKISNVVATIDDQTSTAYVGLFPLLGGDEEFESVIENLEIDGIRFIHGSKLAMDSNHLDVYLGGLVGKMGANSRIENCIVRGFEIEEPQKELTIASDAVFHASPLVGKNEKGSKMIACYGTGKPNVKMLKGKTVVSEKQGEKTDSHNGYIWYQIAEGAYSLQQTDVEIRPVAGPAEFMYEAIVTGGPQKKYSYRWSVNGETLEDKTQTITMTPSYKLLCLNVDVLDGEKVIGTDAYRIDNDTYRMKSTRVTQIGRSYTVSTKIDAQSGLDAAENDFYFQWLDACQNFQEVGSSATLTGAMNDHTYILVAKHRLNRDLEVGYVHTFCQPVYVCNQGISEEEAKNYTNDGKSYAMGNDANDGKTPETAVRTLRRAYELLRPANIGGTPANNVIVIMGDYKDNALSMHLDYKQIKANPNYFEKNKPALITGQLNNFHGGRLLMSGRDIYLNSETCFTQLTLYGVEEMPLANIFACNNKLVMGVGLTMCDYAAIDFRRGLIDGTNAPNFNIYGGYENLDDPNYIPQENFIMLQSGHYGRVIAGGSSKEVTEYTGSVSGSPIHPLQTTVICDISNGNNASHYSYDIALLVGGQTNGSCFANNTLEVTGNTHVGRIVGGNIGCDRSAFIVDKKGKKYARPSDSFYGQTNINIRQGIVGELYGGSLGRFGHRQFHDETDRDSSILYFYGRSNINISGGTIFNSIYGGGACAVSGMDYNAQHHSADPLIPYILSNGKVGFGTYEMAHNQMPRMIISQDSIIDLSETVININISGNAYLMGSVFGGGCAFSDQLSTNRCCSQAGNVYGHTYINMTGGVVKGYIYGGGRGTLSYYDNEDDSGYFTSRNDLGKLGQLFGGTHINISGGDVYGMIFGGGEGCYYRPTSNTDATNIANDMAAVYGTTHVNISGNPTIRESVFGAGNYSNLKRSGNDPDSQAGSSFVNIDGGFLSGCVFGGGHGHYDTANPEHSVFSIIEGDTHLNVTNGEFVHRNEHTHYFDESCYGLFGSGLSTSMVEGDTWVNLYHSPFTSKMLNESGFKAWSNTKNFETRYVYCGGGYGPNTDVIGDTHVLIDVKGAPSIDTEMLSSGTGDRGSIETKSILFMDVYGGGVDGDVHGSTNVTVKGNVFIRNLFGGGLKGDCGIKDRGLNGDSHQLDTSDRKYKTHCRVDVFSGGIGRLFGGAKIADVCGETFVTIGSPTDANNNRNILIEELYGGNDLTGTIAGSNNDKYGTHINIYGGKFNVIYGSGNGQSKAYGEPNIKGKGLENTVVGMPRPHVASASIAISGIDNNNRTEVKEFLYCGGNNTTVGIFKLAKNNRPQYNMLREELIPNSGHIRLNLGSHVKIANLIMGNNGRRLLEYAPSYTTDGEHWYQGFEDDDDFNLYCRTVDVSCVPELTFNKDNQFHNKYLIDDRMNRTVYFDTPGEMDSEDIEIDTFVGGSYSGSMTCDSLYQYTLPPGLLITDKIVGGCISSIFGYVQRQGPNKNSKFTFAGGMRPYRNMEVARDEQRIQLNIFCQFDPIRYRPGNNNRTSHTGTKIYGGCLDKGVIVGVTVVNLHSNMIDEEHAINVDAMLATADEWNSNAAQVFGGGRGEKTEMIGNTYVALNGAIFNGKPCQPMAIRVFGGGEDGTVIGRSNVYCNSQCPNNAPLNASNYSVWGAIYGGGLNGGIATKSKYFDWLPEPKQNGTHVRVWSGQINRVFGGSRNGSIAGASFVDIDDRGKNHSHTIVRTVYGGNDLSGVIGHGVIPGLNGHDSIHTNTYVHIHAHRTADGSFNGFPLIGELFGGGNGNYGTHDKSSRKYTSGTIDMPNGQTLELAGLDLPNVDSTYIEIDGGTIWEVYGGANTSYVDKSTVIDVHYNDDKNSPQEPCVFSRLSSEACYKRGHELTSMLASLGGYTDDGNVVVAENNIRFLYGGNKSSNMSIQPTWLLKGGHIRDLYGGCNESDVVYEPKDYTQKGLLLNIASDALSIDNVYGGCRLGNVWSKGEYGTIVNIKDGNIGRVFGGNDISGYIEHGTHLQLEGGIIGQVYGSGNGEYIYIYDKEADRIYTVYDQEKKRFVCHLPASKEAGEENPTAIQKVLAINKARPNIDRVMIEVGGMLDEKGHRRTVYIHDALYAGGNCATVIGKDGNPGDIQLQINDYSIINNLYLGSNGKLHIDRDYLVDMIHANDISTEEATNHDSNGKGLLEHHMNAVTMYGLPSDFHLRRQYDRCYIGSFFVGGANSSIKTHGSIDITFPRTLNIFNKIVGGSDRARVSIPVKSGVEFYDGGILWDGIGEQPVINLDVQCRFLNREMVMDARYKDSFYLRRLTGAEGIFNSGARVYGGCFLSGKVEGEVNVELSTEEE